ncbi:hypothetical protein GTO27_06095 [Candidatus Bathyarchaeota archaeon]|nr:hypothetical protein [Candidatus Bathyarchaeota archaeon]
MNKILLLFVVALALPCLVNMHIQVSANGGGAGIEAGEWFRYEDIKVSWDSNYSIPSNIAILQLNDTQSWEIACDDVFGTNITFHETIRYKSTSEATVFGWLDIDSGEGRLASKPWGTSYPGALFIAANLSEGDSLYAGKPDVKINETCRVEYFGAVRQSNVVNRSLYSSGYLKTEIMVWDRLSGILCELSVNYFAENRTVGWYKVRLSQTNLWRPFGVHNLDTGLKYARIQEAIDAPETLDGHTIYVEEAVYYENIVVNKSLSVVGEDKSSTVIDGNGIGNTLSIVLDHVNITGFTIRRSGSTTYDAGVYLDNANYCTLSGNNIIDNKYAIMIHSLSNYINIYGNSITNNNFGIRLLSNSHYNNISRNSITNNIEGYGIGLTSSDYNCISKNFIVNNGAGILLGGIIMGSSNYNTVFENTISESSEFGIEVGGHSKDNIFHHNTLVNNNQQVIVALDYTNFWDNGVEGNYWSNYTGSDSNHDGLGDSWHNITQNNVDHYPLIGLFRSLNTSTGENVNVITNSTIKEFHYFDNNDTIRMIVTNMTMNQTHGFCRVCIPHKIMDIGRISVLIDDGATPLLHHNYTLYDDGTHRWIYFAYEHSEHEIAIVPELPLSFILLFIAASQLAVIFYKRKYFIDK